MVDILCGKYGNYEFITRDKVLYSKFVSDKVKWIEQIQISLGDVQSNVFEFLEKAKIDTDLRMYADLARHLTLTPLLFQMCSYEMLRIMEENKIIDKKYVKLVKNFKQKLDNRNVIGNLVLSNISARYPGKKERVALAFLLRKETYRTYLDYILSVIKSLDMGGYKYVDKGQTSSGHYNTCMFNSSFCNECERKIILDPKQGCLDKVQSYITSSINAMKWILPYEEYKEELVFEGLGRKTSDQRGMPWG